MSNPSETPLRPNHKPKLCWSLPDSARPTPDLLRRLPELEGIENNPWYRLLLAGRARRLATASRTKSLVVTSAGLLLVSLLVTAYALWAAPAYLGTTKIHTSLWPTLFFGVASYGIGLLVLMECFGLMTGGLRHPIQLAFGFAREPMRDLYFARNDPREIAQAWFGADCVPIPRFRWALLLVWLTPVSCIFAALCTWRFRDEAAVQLAIVPPMLLAGYGWGLLPHAERVLLHHAARLHPRSAASSTNPLANVAIFYKKLIGFMLLIFWKSVAILSVSYVFLFLIEESDLLSPEAEVLPGLVAWPLYAYWLMLAAFIYGLIQTIYSSKLASSNLDRLATNSPVIMQKLFPEDIELDPPVAKTPSYMTRRTPREFLRWLFRTPVPLSAFGTFTRAVRVSLCSICLLFTAILISPPGSILALFDRYEVQEALKLRKRGYSFSDIQKSLKWNALAPTIFGYHSIELSGFARGTRRIRVHQSDLDFSWIDDFQHLLTSRTKLEFELSSRIPADAYWMKLSSNEGIRKSLTKFHYWPQPKGTAEEHARIDLGLDFSKMEQLEEVWCNPIEVTKSFRLPNTLKHLLFFDCIGLDRVWIDGQNSRLKSFEVGGSVNLTELKSFLTQNEFEAERMQIPLPDVCRNFKPLSELVRCKSLSIWIGRQSQNLEGIDAIPGLESLEISGYYARDRSLWGADTLPELESLTISAHSNGDFPSLLRFQNLKFLYLQDIEEISPELMATLQQLDKLEQLEFSVAENYNFTPFGNSLQSNYVRVLDKPSTTYPRRLRHRLAAEAAYIEAKVRWPEALEKGIKEINAIKSKEAAKAEAERKLAETPVTDENASQILWPNSSP